VRIEAEVCGVKLGDGHEPRLMGVINLSPESFYKGSVAKGADEAAERAKKMAEEGADFIDLGAMSTAPGTTGISELEEGRSLIPALKQILDEVNIPVSVDTQRSAIALDALELGAGMINDISGFRSDPEMAEVAAEHGCPVVLMATEKAPGDAMGMGSVLEMLSDSISIALEAGVEEGNIIVDPGIGRWVPEKTYEYNLEIIGGLEALRVFKRPVLVGISRKSFIGDILGEKDPAKRLPGTLSATAVAVYNGAHIIRSHDVGETREVARIAQGLRGRRIIAEEGGTRGGIIDHLGSREEAERIILGIGAEEGGAKAMSGKAVHRVILLENLRPEAALILKQEILALGGDAAVPRRALIEREGHVDVLLFGSQKQLRTLAVDLRKQPFGLAKGGRVIEELLEREGDPGYRYGPTAL